MKRAWWKESVVYQIYPRSFADSDGDGVGDLRGIIGKLDYLKTLGIDVVWLSPVYKSPNDDNGYDISDYQDIMSEFGTLADWAELIAGMHARRIKLVMDLVVNHTSDEHPWFLEAKKSKDNPYRDYYIWRAPVDGHEPNNWASFFSGSAWQYDETTGEYFLHLFSKKQPDLNWENPKVRAEIFAMMRWWLDKGVDGFRMDVINMISKTPGLPSVAQNGKDVYQFGGEYFVNGPRLLEFLGEMKAQVLSKYDILTVGETPMVDPPYAVVLTNEDNGVLNMLFQFEHMDLDADRGGEAARKSVKPWQLDDLKEVMSRWETELEGKGWNSIYLSNHDQPRALSRFGNDREYRVQSAKLLATFTHMLQGTPYIYQGEEIGMTNVAFDSIAEYRDIETLNLYDELVNGKGMSPAAVMHIIHLKSRDNARTPMQWSGDAQARFTSGTPWIAVNPNYREINVEQALQDADSIFRYYQKLIRLRRQHPVIVYGRYDLIPNTGDEVYAFTRTLGEEQLLVVLNFRGGTPVFEVPQELREGKWELMIGNYEGDGEEEMGRMGLRAYEARVYML